MSLAIEYCHSKGVIHRDLKLTNIFIQEGTTKIGDFGLARQTGKREGKYIADTAVIATLSYAAPEFVKGKDHTNKIDIWSFGVIAYEMFVGKKAFPGRD